MKTHIYAFCAGLLLSGVTFAADIGVTWTNPTAYTDGTALPATDITQTRIEYGTCTSVTPPTFGVKSGEVISTGNGTTATIKSPTPGTYCIQAKTTAKGVESAPSGVVTKQIVQPAPNPPTAVTIGTLIAYDIVKQPGKLVLLAVGRVDAGVVCDTSQSVNGLYAVPTSAVRWFGTVRPPVAFAACG